MILIFAIVEMIRAGLPDKCMQSGVMALTFDDGPTAYTSVVLDQLEEMDVKATFHFTVQNIARGNISGLMRRAVEEGHTVGLRVNPKRDYDSMDSEGIQNDVDGQIKVLNNEIDDKIKYARAPAPDNMPNQDVYEAFKKQDIIQTGYTYCFYHDAEDADQAISQFSKILETSPPEYESFIFLLHEEMEKTFPLLEDIVTMGKKKGYKFVTMDECLKGYKPGEVVVPGKGSALKDSSSAEPILLIPLCLLCMLFI